MNSPELKRPRTLDSVPIKTLPPPLITSPTNGANHGK